MLGIPQCKKKNKEKETFQKQSAMLKLPLALVWHPPKETGPWLWSSQLGLECAGAVTTCKKDDVPNTCTVVAADQRN